jgi:putative ABC transport system permease protein
MKKLDVKNKLAPGDQQVADAHEQVVRLDVKNQPTLSVGRTLEIAFNGMRYRLFRSVLTVMVIAVAIAFLMNVVCEAISMRSISRIAHARTMTSRLAALWSGRLTIVGTREALLREIADTAPSSRLLLAEDRQFAQLPASDTANLQRNAQIAVRYLDYFTALPYATRRLLVRHATSTDIFDQLQPSAAREAFFATLARYHLRLPDAQFNAFLDSWGTSFAQQLDAMRQGHTQAIARLAPALAGRPLQVALLDADQTFGQQVYAAGFVAFDNGTRKIVADEARQASDIMMLQESITSPALRTDLSGYLNVMPGDINLNVLWDTLHNPSDAAWYLGKLAQSGQPLGDLTAGRIVTLAKMKSDSESLENALNMTAEASGGFLGMGTRMTWLVFISLLVCVVGISNAMLMSVTERFREIATLKCLGALDAFIMTMFLTEACLLGLVGGVIGSLLGSVIGFGRMTLTFGAGMLFSSFPAASWGVGLLLAVVVGVLLAAFAGVYPSYLAARLAPMEAMRIE